MSLLTRDYDYPLPEALIARHPLARRDQSRMLVIHRSEGRMEDRQFSELPAFLREGDLLVLNNTRVIPARVYSDDGRIELLFLEAVGPNRWKCLVKPGRRMTVGKSVLIQQTPGHVTEICPEGERILEFEAPIDLERVGELPIPPYFGRSAEAADAERYQTVYATSSGAVAAPTAGLHFTSEMLARIPHAFVTLHVGVGTFRPVQVESLTEHRMHAERFEISESAARAINAAKRVIAIGTTTTRVLESCGRPVGPRNSQTDIFIYPPYQFKVIDALLTNFHLPKSTLLMMVSALMGRELALKAYAHAIEEKYRFYSYGDCMLVL